MALWFLRLIRKHREAEVRFTDSEKMIIGVKEEGRCVSFSSSKLVFLLYSNLSNCVILIS